MAVQSHQSLFRAKLQKESPLFLQAGLWRQPTWNVNPSILAGRASDRGSDLLLKILNTRSIAGASMQAA